MPTPEARIDRAASDCDSCTSNEGISFVLGEIDRRTSRIEKLLTGNGDPQSGIIVRLDRVEQKMKGLLWVVGICCGTFLTSMVLTLFDLMTSK